GRPRTPSLLRSLRGRRWLQSTSERAAWYGNRPRSPAPAAHRHECVATTYRSGARRFPFARTLASSCEAERGLSPIGAVRHRRRVALNAGWRQGPGRGRCAPPPHRERQFRRRVSAAARSRGRASRRADGWGRSTGHNSDRRTPDRVRRRTGRLRGGHVPALVDRGSLAARSPFGALLLAERRGAASRIRWPLTLRVVVRSIASAC